MSAGERAYLLMYTASLEAAHMSPSSQGSSRWTIWTSSSHMARYENLILAKERLRGRVSTSGGLLQSATRDTLKFAYKASAA